MKNGEVKFILGVAIGAAIGAAVAYVITSGKKDEWIDTINDVVEHVKDKVEEIASTGKDEIEAVADKVNTSLKGILSRA